MRDAVIVEAVRTPIGRGHPEKGQYKDVHAADLLGRTYTEILDRTGQDPNEVEDVIVKHPLVMEAAVIGLPDEQSGEVVVAYVVRKDPALTPDDLRQFCRENMTGYKVPRRIEFRESLPKTNVGKVLRRALKEEQSQAR